MKHLKDFKTFEAVIMPKAMKEPMPFRTFDDVVKYGEMNGFDVVDYPTFFESLGEDDKKTAPPRTGSPFFALYHPIRKKPMFVICDEYSIKMIPYHYLIGDIMEHELVHGEQNFRRKGLTFNLPNPMVMSEYFSNTDEIMAFSHTIAKKYFKKYKSFDDAKIIFTDGGISLKGDKLWNDILNNCSKDVLKKYRKYIYLYLEELYSEK